MENSLKLNLALKKINQKGLLKYEYNPFHNYRTSVNLYKKEGFIIPEGQAVNKKNGKFLHKEFDSNKKSRWVDDFGNIIKDDTLVLEPDKDHLYARAGSLIDLDTDKLNFDLLHPVDITIQPSYDGSVNLILNDDKNIPKLINSRFSPREKDTYEIVDRIGENDTNVYNDTSFDKDSSLYFLFENNPLISFFGYVDGSLPVGQYYFCVTYCDSDDNESDYIAESGLIPVFIGSNNYASSMDGGIKNLNSNKGIILNLQNLDKSYNYVKIYYIRYLADYQLNRVYEGKKIYRKYPISSSNINIQITGNELTEDIDPNILNITRFNPKSVLTQAQCKNMLFFGNIVKNTDNYKELTDCALRILPSIYKSSIDDINEYYVSYNSYYNINNIYNKVGYSNLEFYRFGVVFIYNNGTLSNVYNTSGYILDGTSLSYNKSMYFNSGLDPILLERNYIQIDDSGWITSASKYINGTPRQLNAKGVCKIEMSEENFNTVYGILFKIDEEIITHLKKLGIRGLFFVRQKCVPNIISLMYVIPMDDVLQAPVIKYNNKLYTESFIDRAGYLTLDYEARLRERSVDSFSKSYAGICPDFLLNLPYYNQIFNNNEFYILKIYTGELNKNNRHYYDKGNGNITYDNPKKKVNICSVTEDVPTVALNNKIYRLNIGEATLAYRFRSFGLDLTSYSAGDEDQAYLVTNIVRGIYSPYLAIYSEENLETNCLYNIYYSNNKTISLDFQIRMNSSEPFYAISNRYNFKNLVNYENNTNKQLVCYRGDCFINLFTYRLNRNFNDPTLPNNDDIIDTGTWGKYYLGGLPNEDGKYQRDFSKIILSDVNAVLLGSWITFKLKSHINYALRSLDNSYVSEKEVMNHPRTFMPRNFEMLHGDYKMPDSYLYNDAYRATLGFKTYFTLLDINYIKNAFSNRIQYSAIAILDSFKNNYRESLSTYFRDYSSEYGGITKLVEYNGNLLVVFEHAIGLAVINERILAGQGEGNPVFINTQNVLPEELTIITDTYGSLWTESIVKSEAGYVYGVDTITKKIWRVRGLNIEILSDFKVGKFLNDNITLSEQENTPFIGIRNVKTHYNNNKKDIMFTFYDDYYLDEEKVWNLCYNELLGQFITFYSWIPSYSENIDTLFFTFNRNTSKLLSLLFKNNYFISENKGILVEDVIISPNENDSYKNFETTLHYRTIEGELAEVEFELEKDHWGNNNLFKIVDDNKLKVIEELKENSGYYLIISVKNGESILKTQNIFLTTGIANLTTDFYLHGKSGIFNVSENLYPTHWYGEFHPFEFEFVVNDKVAQLKIFNNLVIISNKAEPESFHFEIEGDNYEFSSDKRAMYVRLEATKELYLGLGSDILFNRKYYEVVSSKYTLEQSYRARNNDYMEQYSKMDRVYPVYEEGLVQQVKSTIFPLYYEKIDTYNDIYHKYHLMHDDDGVYDFQNLSGSEISWDRDLNQFNIITHIKNNPIPLVGRIRGNSFYKEGTWNIQIPSITFMLKNEEKEWPTNEDGKTIPPIVLNSQYVPKDLDKTTLGIEDLPNIYDCSTDPTKYIDTSSWTARKEAKIRDKWVKIRIRYSGKNLAVIHSLITLYNISYS